MSSDDTERLSEFLSKNGLTHNKWLKHFKDKNITKVDQIHELEYKDDVFESLSFDANQGEMIALQKIFERVAPIDAPDVGLDRELNEVGLDILYWSEVFKRELGVKSQQALENIGEESFQLLAQFVRQPWEKRALRKLLKLESVESSYKKKRETQRAKLEKRQAESARLLGELKILEKEGRERNDSLVKAKEEKIREMLQTPGDTWVPTETSLSQVIQQMEDMHDNISGTLKTREDLSEVDVIKSSSSGLALQGILIAADPTEAAEVRKNLLRVPADVCLDGPSDHQHDKIQQFFSQKKEADFSKRLKMLGYSASASAKAGFYGFSFEASAGYSQSQEEEETTEHHQEETYCSVVKYSLMPLASCTFKDHQLQLSEDALLQLQKINKQLVKDLTQPIQRKCEEFFRDFGSHACIGPLHFGGRYSWKSYSSGFKESEKSTVQELQSEAISVQVGMSYSGIAGASAATSVSRMKGSLKGKYSEALKSQTFVEVSKYGGPPEATGLPDWKNGLVASNSTWFLIDRGTRGMAVWEIIELNHASSFKSCSFFAEKLKQAWQKLNKTDELQRMALTTEFQSVMDAIAHWNANLDPTQFSTRLIQLVAHKEKVAKKFLNPQVWATEYLSQEVLQKYLRSVVDHCLNDAGNESGALKRYLQELVERIDLGITRVFPNQQYVMEWLYNTKESVPPMECKDFLSLSDFFKLALECMPSKMLKQRQRMIATAVSTDCLIRATTVIAKATYCLRSHLQRSGQKYEDLFTTTMLYPFKYIPSKYRFSVLLSSSDLNYLCENFDRYVNEFFSVKAKNSLLNLQSHLFLLTVTLYDYFDVNEEHVIRHIEYMEREIGGEIEQELSRILDELKLKESGCDWELFGNELESLAQDILSKPEDGRVLIEVLEQRKEQGKATTVSNLRRQESHSLLQGNKEVENLFLKLHLTKEYPQKLSLSHALAIREDTLEVSKKHEAEEDEHEFYDMETLHCDPQMYPFHILQKIMCVDHRCRMPLASDSDSSDEAMVHPMDGLLALLHCSDDFLRKDLMSRLATCQLAIPALIPHPMTRKPTFLLWAMRSIIKEFRNHNGSVSYAGPIVHYPAPIVSFLRFGTHSVSKSKLLNTVMSTSNHPTFFHYDCAGGRAKRVLVEGLVEMSWYIPSKNDKRLPDAVTFANLHGDASKYPEQVQFLSAVSCMHFVLLNEGELKEDISSVLKQLSKAPGGIVILQTRASPSLEPKLKQSVPEKLSIIELFTMNENRRKVNILKLIRGKLMHNLKLTLEDCKRVASDCGIKVDEAGPECSKGKELADEFHQIVAGLKKSNPDESPKKLLVLQSKALWHKYGEYDKEQYRQTRKGQMSMYEYSGMQQNKMNQIRKRQNGQSQKLSQLMTSFLTSLLTTEGRATWYYLHWLKIHLDDLSRELLPPLHTKYEQKRKELNDIQKQEKKSKNAEDICRSQMNELNMQLLDASFGPEHMFREIGQLYEVVMSQKDAPKKLQMNISRLPQIAAQLLVDGFPLELMDGDAAHVPIDWVSTVLEKLSEILKQKNGGTSNPQLFVLSVLGLQSTGKSTMLNTIFGVQFSVSAGRCTRGAFMQLLPIHESLQEKCGFQYFLIVDTEGLRAPELDALKMQRHDNELATFVIGLANLTIINIKGEISGDMDDVLQTTVHAFLRMNEVKLRPSCHFVYQNVAAVAADEKAMQGRFKIKDKLDAMTRKAAEQAGLVANLFCDVITFDYEHDVSFFPDLWIGRPPMAHVSEFYSIEAQTLKYYLIRGVERNQKSRNNSVLQLKTHLEELWKAILQENFVFSFKNTFEIAAYTKLEQEYSEWSRSFKKQMDVWEQAAQNILMSCFMENLPTEYQAKKAELPKCVNDEYKKLNGMMDKYFDESTEQETIAKWKDETESDLKYLKKKLERHAAETCDQLFNFRNNRARADSKIENMCSEIMEHVQHVASGLEKGRLNEQQLRKRFEKSWVGWITELTPNIDEIKPPNIKNEVETCVREYQTLKAYHKLLLNKLTQPDSKTGERRQWGVHLTLKIRPVHLKSLKSWWLHRKWEGVDGYIRPAQEKTNSVVTEVDKWLTRKRDSGEDFKPNFTSELLDLLFDKIAEDPSDSFDYTPEYSVEMALTVCGYGRKVFQDMNDTFCKKHDPLVYIETELKEECWKQFKDNYNDIEREKTAAETLCSHLKKAVKTEVILQLESAVCEKMRNELTWLSTKKRLRAKVLHDIGQKLEQDRILGKPCKFDPCALYLKHPSQSLEHWLARYTDEYCNEGAPTIVSKIATEKLLLVLNEVRTGANKVTKLLASTPHPGQKSPQVKMSTQGQCLIIDWLDQFHNELRGKLTMDLTKLRTMLGNNPILKSVTFFGDEVVKGLHKLHEQLEDEFRCLSADVWIRHKLAKKPNDTLFEELVGCTELCPFCKQQCDHTNAKHPDSVLHTVKHRPKCLGGTHYSGDQTMSLDVCTFSVAANHRFRSQATNNEYYHYSEYKKFYPNWDIPGEKSLPASEFWIWLVGKFSKEIEACFGLSDTKIYDDWQARTWSPVKQALKKEYKES
jgi:hypothetical protein